MSFSTIMFDVPEQGIGRLTLNRPDQYNALNRTLTEEASEVLTEFAAHDELQVMILTGSGKSFSAGGDLAWLLEATATRQGSNHRSSYRSGGSARCRRHS